MLLLRLLAFLLQLVHAQHLLHLHIQPRPGFPRGLAVHAFGDRLPASATASPSDSAIKGFTGGRGNRKRPAGNRTILLRHWRASDSSTNHGARGQYKRRAAARGATARRQPLQARRVAMLTIDIYHQQFTEAFASLQARVHDVTPCATRDRLQHTRKRGARPQSDPLGHRSAIVNVPADV